MEFARSVVYGGYKCKEQWQRWGPLGPEMEGMGGGDGARQDTSCLS